MLAAGSDRELLRRAVVRDHGRDLRRRVAGDLADLDVAGPHGDAVVLDHPVGQDRRQQRDLSR